MDKCTLISSLSYYHHIHGFLRGSIYWSDVDSLIVCDDGEIASRSSRTCALYASLRSVRLKELRWRHSISMRNNIWRVQGVLVSSFCFAPIWLSGWRLDWRWCDKRWHRLSGQQWHSWGSRSAQESLLSVLQLADDIFELKYSTLVLQCCLQQFELPVDCLPVRVALSQLRGDDRWIVSINTSESIVLVRQTCGRSCYKVCEYVLQIMLHF